MPSPENKQNRNQTPTTQHTPTPTQPTNSKDPQPDKHAVERPATSHSQRPCREPRTKGVRRGLSHASQARKPTKPKQPTTQPPNTTKAPNQQRTPNQKTRGGKASYWQLSAAFCRQSETYEPTFRDAGRPRQRPPKTQNQTKTKTKPTRQTNTEERPTTSISNGPAD